MSVGGEGAGGRDISVYIKLLIRLTKVFSKTLLRFYQRKVNKKLLLFKHLIKEDLIKYIF